ncbi:hypothetical protein A3A09_00975 [Candidatus Nomurabacteria bacterium RIFCSPLOWO2_01_FULL_42_20]|uniref:DinB-like domain-containing protein n=1 Tax=Candidatus Nomurabacteria bacterium RIFCSPHIGHO2_01_FULL_42_16 TaxID=1801743 RepID=A0A1F6VHT3_9BACT|nr:MAG: hypothetical protein A2824_01280 [Candidatus Nomurabacteria bacterium RIFCSPHIGHO2_01_FULL_42_16]OGI92534.1 MAG: hypothetical protein A3A09_00975 [Candidatus Nomurabacteria bacterium RIFCSPLOWO2_01_FULL_42_20]
MKIQKISDKDSVIKSLTSAHQSMTKTLEMLSQEQIKNSLVTNLWTPKDIISHLVDWNLEYFKEIDNILNDKPTWQDLYSSKKGTDKFNERAVMKRKNIDSKEVIKEWHLSFEKLLEKLQGLSEKQWGYSSKVGKWIDGQPISVGIIFNYTYNGLSHEAGHAEKIKEKIPGIYKI